MCPDEEVIQSEVAEANKMLVKKASVDEGSGAEDEDSLLPESLQKQNDAKNSVNNNNVLDQENNPVKNEVENELVENQNVFASSSENIQQKAVEETDDIPLNTEDQSATETTSLESAKIESEHSETNLIIKENVDVQEEKEEEEAKGEMVEVVTAQIDVIDDDDTAAEKHDLEKNVDDSNSQADDKENTVVDAEVSNAQEEEKTDDHESEKCDEMKDHDDDDEVSEVSGATASTTQVAKEEQNETKEDSDNPECDQIIDNQPHSSKVDLENIKSYPQDLNPFGSDDEEEEDDDEVIVVSTVSTNPFGSDSEPEVEERQQSQVSYIESIAYLQ